MKDASTGSVAAPANSLISNLRSAPLAGQLALAASAFTVVVAVLIAVYVLFLRTPYSPLFTNLRIADAATIVADLDKKKIPYKLKDGGATILVPENLQDSTRLSITSEDLPLKGAVGFELFNKSDMGLTEFAQKINYQRALQGELARTIMSIDAVETARVHLTLAEATIFRDDRKPSKASVSLTPRQGQPLTSKTVEGVQRLVAAAVPDLDPNAVVVLDETGMVVSSKSNVDFQSDLKFQERSAVEQYYTTKIRDALSGIYPGHTEITVVANVYEQTASEGMEDGWTRPRTFPLSIEIAFAEAPAPDTQQRVRAAVTEVAGLDPMLGDVVLLSTAVASQSQLMNAAPTVSPTAPAKSMIPALPVREFWAVHLVPVFGALFLAALVLLLLRPRKRKLSARERSEYARRLRGLLTEGDAGVS